MTETQARYSYGIGWYEACGTLREGWKATVYDNTTGKGVYATPRFSGRQNAEERAKEWIEDHTREAI